MADGSRQPRSAPPPPPRRTSHPGGGFSTASLPVPSAGAALVPFGALVVAAAVAVGLGLWAWQDGAGTTSTVSGTAVAGWVCGGVVALLLFAWFRAVMTGRQADPYFVEPSWRPTRWAGVVAGVVWLAGVGCAFLVGAAVARR